MGTRGLIGFRLDGKDYTTYNHFDSYPTGVGADILAELKKVKDWKKVKGFVKAIRLVTDDNPPSPEDIRRFKKWHEGKVSTGQLTEWYSLLRELQGTLEPYLKGEVDVMINSSEFIRDSLFCEWAYIVNLDTGFLEVWMGFQKTPWKKNRYGTKAESGHDNKYYPCKRVAVFDLKTLPSKADFVALEKLDSSIEDN
ncbi:MAG: hypothetical protein PVI03_02040 [Candidatus Thorarchaeota archaeon]|jgi:hypothetical protein